MKGIIKEVISKYGQGKMRYAVINIGKIPEAVDLNFREEFPSDESLKRYIEKMQMSTDTPYLDKALKKAKLLFEKSGRPNAIKIFVIITDKKSASSSELLSEKAKPLVNDGVRVIPVALGPDSDVDELERITPNKDNVLKFNSSSTPRDITKVIMDKLLQGE